MEIKIIPCLNGAMIEVVKSPDEMYEEVSSTDRYSYEFEDSNLESLQTMCYDICELLGNIVSKHNKFNLYHVIDNGYDYEQDDMFEECQLCGRKKR